MSRNRILRAHARAAYVDQICDADTPDSASAVAGWLRGPARLLGICASLLSELLVERVDNIIALVRVLFVACVGLTCERIGFWQVLRDRRDAALFSKTGSQELLKTMALGSVLTGEALVLATAALATASEGEEEGKVFESVALSKPELPGLPLLFSLGRAGTVEGDGLDIAPVYSFWKCCNFAVCGGAWLPPAPPHPFLGTTAYRRAPLRWLDAKAKKIACARRLEPHFSLDTATASTHSSLIMSNLYRYPVPELASNIL